MQAVKNERGFAILALVVIAGWAVLTAAAVVLVGAFVIDAITR